MVFLTQMAPCLHAYTRTRALANRWRGARGLYPKLAASEERNMVRTLGK